MSFTAIYNAGKIKELDLSLKKYRIMKPRSGLLTSFSNRIGSLALGIFLAALGVAMGYILLTEKMKLFTTIVAILGVACIPLGVWIAIKSLSAMGKTARPHRFFSYDDSRVAMGTTRPIGQDDIRRVRQAPKPERVGLLTALAPGYVEIPVKDIASVGLYLAKPTLNIDKLQIKGGGASILVDFDSLLPSINFSGINGNLAFNSISMFYTRATGKTIEAAIES